MNNYNTPNSGCCGRPMRYATSVSGGQNHCCFNEYDYKMSACIRKQQPNCNAQAIIPATTLESTLGLNNYTNCLVHVLSNNTTYYVDSKGTPIITWRGDVEAQLPTDTQSQEEFDNFVKSFDLKSQFLYVKFYQETENKNMIEAFYFDKIGRIYWAGEYEDTEIGG